MTGHQIARRFASVVGLAASLLMVGCGGGATMEAGLVPVSGRVTLDGGAWPRPGTITFSPTKAGRDPGAAAVSSVASFGTDGSFVVRREGADGLKPGNYWVAVDCPEETTAMPPPGKKPTVANAAPAKYRNPETSGFSFDVGASKAPEATFDVKSK